MDLDNIHISNPELLMQKKEQIEEEKGLKSIHVVADFDRTLTKGIVNNRHSLATWDIFPLGEEYEFEMRRLADIYLPIEYDPFLDPTLKKEKMAEWWSKHLALLIKYGLNKNMLRQAVTQEKLIPRPGLKELLAFTHEHSIPVLIFSGGVGDIIVEFLKYHHIHYPNIHVLSNFFNFNGEGKAVGFKDTMVHAGNKSEVQLIGKPYMKEITHRKNVILLGDSLSDARMAEGIPHNNIIKIGFLNEQHEKLQSYKIAFDMVSTEDTGVHFVTRLLSSFKK